MPESQNSEVKEASPKRPFLGNSSVIRSSNSQTVLYIFLQVRPQRKHCLQQFLYCQSVAHLLGNVSANTFPQQHIHTPQQNCWTCCFLHDLCHIKENMLLVLPRTSCPQNSFFNHYIKQIQFKKTIWNWMNSKPAWRWNCLSWGTSV